METLLSFLVLASIIAWIITPKKVKSDLIFILPLIPLAIAAASATQKFIAARKQRKEAKKAEGYVPPALKAAENIDRIKSNATRYAGQDIDEANIRQASSDAIGNTQRASSSSGDVLNASARIQGQQNKAMQNVSRGAMMFRENAMDKYRNTQGQVAQAQADSRGYAEGLRGAAMQNVYGGVNDILSGVVAANQFKTPMVGAQGASSTIPTFSRNRTTADRVASHFQNRYQLPRYRFQNNQFGLY